MATQVELKCTCSARSARSVHCIHTGVYLQCLAMHIAHTLQYMECTCSGAWESRMALKFYTKIRNLFQCMKCNVTKLPYIRITLMVVTVLLMYTLAQINVVSILLMHYNASRSIHFLFEP